MKRIAFLNDTSSWYHWGCTGTSEAIKAALQTRCYEIISVPIHELYACQLVPTKTQDFDDPAFFNRFFHENLAITAPILQSDIVVINGEGSLHGLSQIVIVLLYLAYASNRYCQKQVHLINHSCYPNSRNADDSRATALYQGVYRHLDFIAVRERYSLDNVKRLGASATLAFDCLPLYIRDHYTTGQASQASRSLVVAGSVGWQPTGIAALAEYMRVMSADGYDVKVLTGAKAYPAQDDKGFLAALRDAMPDGWTHIDAPSMQTWLETIDSAELLISGRFHYTIAACALGTPCIVLSSNTPKNQAICQESGMLPSLSYMQDDLFGQLQERTNAILGKPPLTENIRQEWLLRAEQNFIGL